MRKLYWADLTTEEFKTLDPEKTIAVLPIAAMEQHGPHLAVSVDTVINEGMIAETMKILPDDLSVLVMPTQAIGKSNEHIRSPGTLTFSAETALRAWVEIGECVHRAGLRKIVMVNSHGGNVDLISIVCRELRVRFQMLAVSCNWGRLGSPPGLHTELESAVGIHAGDNETSMMLYFRPDRVRMDKAKNFAPSTIQIAKEFDLLRPTGLNAFGWIAQDIHPDGAAGDASVATAEKGKLAAEHRAKEFVKLLRDMTRFDLKRLA
ncbi:MAG: creatininase [Rhizobiales bacterium 65-9]|nr:creatininase family protein [Hyphomicrobiales bacterium]OJY37946.1 MAG: creatininase [Rhizobiales bacterium 65-9]